MLYVLRTTTSTIMAKMINDVSTLPEGGDVTAGRYSPGHLSAAVMRNLERESQPGERVRRFLAPGTQMLKSHLHLGGPAFESGLSGAVRRPWSGNL